jgi:hypothetical protein
LDTFGAFADFGKFGSENASKLDPNAVAVFHELHGGKLGQLFEFYDRGEKMFDAANTLKKDGFIKGSYTVCRDFAVEKATEIVGEITTETAAVIMATGAAPSFPVILLACATGYLAKTAVQSALEKLFDMLEEWLKEAFAGLNIDAQLNDMLSAARKELDQALDDRMRGLEAEQANLQNAAQLSGRLDSALRNVPNPTLGIAIISGMQLAQQTWSVLDKTQPVKGGPPPSSGGNIVLYDIRISGPEAQNATGKAWAIRYALPRDIAADSIRLALQTTGTDPTTGITPTQYIGIIREYKVDQKWLEAHAEATRYEGFNRPPRPIIGQYP